MMTMLMQIAKEVVKKSMIFRNFKQRMAQMLLVPDQEQTWVVWRKQKHDSHVANTILGDRHQDLSVSAIMDECCQDESQLHLYLMVNLSHF